MSRFPIHTLETAPAPSRPILDQVRAAWGFVPKLQGTLAESPVTLQAHETLFRLVGESSLSKIEQQVTLLTVSVLHGCEYCTAGHTYLARSVGAPEDAIQAVRSGAPIPEPRLQALRAFTEAVVRERGRAGDEAVEAFLSAGFTQAQVLEVVTAIALKTISNYVNHLTHTPQEPFMADPALRWVAPQGAQAR